MSVDRNSQMTTWVAQQLGHDQFEIQGLAGDASFRGYARVDVQGRKLIVMDAPPSHEDCRPFVGVAGLLAAHDVNVPEILAQDFEQGFLLLEDFGNTLLSQVLDTDNVDAWYGLAMNQIIHMQKAPTSGEAWSLPPYDQERLLTEMRLFDQWFIPKFLGLQLSDTEQHLIDSTYDMLAKQALMQPQVFVHRDYHCRNLMVTDREGKDINALGVIDFQDALVGAITYDLVSLLRDAYVQWPTERVHAWVHTFWQRAQIQGLIPSVPQAQFMQWFDWMGAQRHLKILGIFVRLSQRDGKHGYLPNLPLVLYYLIHEIKAYPELAAFAAWLQDRIVPAFVAKVPDSQALLESA